MANGIATVIYGILMAISVVALFQGAFRIRPDVVYTGVHAAVLITVLFCRFLERKNLPYKSSWMTIFAAILLVLPPFLVSAYGHAWWIGGVGPIMLFLLVFSYESTP